jgi:hypothetical protein
MLLKEIMYIFSEKRILGFSCQTHCTELFKMFIRCFLQKHSFCGRFEFAIAVTTRNAVFWFAMPCSLVEYKVITAVVMKSSIFSETAPYSLLKVNQCFGGTCHLHLQVQRISQARNQSEADSNEKLMGVYSSFEGRRVSKEFCMLLIL